jgi:UvrD-like helicase family protein
MPCRLDSRKYIVDEAQDCDDHQLAVLDWLRRAGTHVVTICDPDQAIYEFRSVKPASSEQFNSIALATVPTEADDWKTWCPKVREAISSLPLRDGLLWKLPVSGVPRSIFPPVQTLRASAGRYARLIVQRCSGNKRQACQVLGISYHTLRAHLRQPNGARTTGLPSDAVANDDGRG